MKRIGRLIIFICSFGLGFCLSNLVNLRLRSISLDNDFFTSDEMSFLSAIADVMDGGVGTILKTSEYLNISPGREGSTSSATFKISELNLKFEKLPNFTIVKGIDLGLDR